MRINDGLDGLDKLPDFSFGGPAFLSARPYMRTPSVKVLVSGLHAGPDGALLVKAGVQASTFREGAPQS